MKHFQIISVALLLYVAAIWLFGPAKNQPPPLAEPAAAQMTPGTLPGGSATLSAQEFEARLTAERIRQLEAVAKRIQQVEVATASTLTYRKQAQLAAYPGWKQAVATNQAAYLHLLAQAKSSPHGEVPCTLCDGLSYMPCAMCLRHNGKCVSCGGSGHILNDALCPNCLGNGKCYLCSGSGKMFCPYCNDGVIEARRPPPPNFPPLD